MSSNGTLENLGQTNTGGTGARFGAFAPNKITTASPSPGSHYLYAANGGSDDVSAFRINPQTGGLTSVTGSPFFIANSFADDFGALSLVASTNSRFLYAVGAGGLATFRINASTGALTLIGSILPRVPESRRYLSADLSPNGRFLAVGGDEVVVTYRLNEITGLPSLVGVFKLASGDTGNFHGVQFDRSGPDRLYVGEAGPLLHVRVGVFDFDPLTGQLSNGTRMTFFPPNVGRRSFVVLPTRNGQHLFVSNQTTEEVTVLKIQKATGILSKTTPGVFDADVLAPSRMVIDPTNQFLYVGGSMPDRSVGQVAGFRIVPGSLVPVSGSPYSTSENVSFALTLFSVGSNGC